jgi:superfamily I DNA/RNA helicase
MIVWAEIYSTIQGSTEAHKCPDCYISEQMYVEYNKNKFLNESEKREIFFIFRLYKNWKTRLNKFDQTDLVNHLLRKILRNSYQGPIINFLFIDEVQDLTPATIYLISQIVSNTIFYAGDTAQSISKGVIFKFSDIKLLFKRN